MRLEADDSMEVLDSPVNSEYNETFGNFTADTHSPLLQTGNFTASSSLVETGIGLATSSSSSIAASPRGSTVIPRTSLIDAVFENTRPGLPLAPAPTLSPIMAVNSSWQAKERTIQAWPRMPELANSLLASVHTSQQAQNQMSSLTICIFAVLLMSSVIVVGLLWLISKNDSKSNFNAVSESPDCRSTVGSDGRQDTRQRPSVPASLPTAQAVDKKVLRSHFEPQSSDGASSFALDSRSYQSRDEDLDDLQVSPPGMHALAPGGGGHEGAGSTSVFGDKSAIAFFESISSAGFPCGDRSGEAGKASSSKDFQSCNLADPSANLLAYGAASVSRAADSRQPGEDQVLDEGKEREHAVKDEDTASSGEEYTSMTTSGGHERSADDLFRGAGEELRNALGSKHVSSWRAQKERQRANTDQSTASLATTSAPTQRINEYASSPMDWRRSD